MLKPLLLIAVVVCHGSPLQLDHCKDGTALLQTRRPVQARPVEAQEGGKDPQRLPRVPKPDAALEPSWQELLQRKFESLAVGCDESPKCNSERLQVISVFGFLVISICVSVCAFAAIREDKEEQITPLCPQLVVQSGELKLSLNLENPVGRVNIVDADKPKEVLCRLVMEWSATGTGHGIAAQVRLQNEQGLTLATLVARNISVSGQALALCRSGCEIFGFVEPEGDARYRVRHRTNVHLMSLVGDFDQAVDAISPAGSKIGGVKMLARDCEISVAEHVDGGLLICSYMAAFVHRKLTKALSEVPTRTLKDKEPSSGGTTPRFEEAEPGTKPAEQTKPAKVPHRPAVPELSEGDPFKPSYEGGVEYR